MKVARQRVRYVALSVFVAGGSGVFGGCGSQAPAASTGGTTSNGTGGSSAMTSASGGATMTASGGTTTNAGGETTTNASGGAPTNAGGGTTHGAAGTMSRAGSGSAGMPASGETGGAGMSNGRGGEGGRGAAGAAAGGRLGRGGTGAGGTPSSGGAGGTPSSGGAGGTPSSGGAAGAGDITVPAGYTLVWHDEFDVDGAPDPKNWKFESGFVRNEEDQWYQTANATVANGELVIEARKEQVPNPNYQAGSSDWKTNRQYADYTSSSINTSGLQSWQYGRFEMRARIPTASGMWPAWWTLGVKGEWPSNGEIDIMEYYQNKVLANVACGTSTEWQAKWDSSSKSLSSLGANWSDDFHVWRMDWDDQNITLSLDDQTVNTAALSSMLNADGSSPFKQKAYMLINLALGGQNGGSLDGTTFPQRYEVDYVRVFQKN